MGQSEGLVALAVSGSGFRGREWCTLQRTSGQKSVGSRQKVWYDWGRSLLFDGAV